MRETPVHVCVPRLVAVLDVWMQRGRDERGERSVIVSWWWKWNREVERECRRQRVGGEGWGGGGKKRGRSTFGLAEGEGGVGVELGTSRADDE